ncbi:MAG: ATP-dependent DNA ligase, partial [Acidimicrobiales bacterium]
MSALHALVEASNAVAATSARNDKVAILASYLAEVDVDEVQIAVALLTGEPRQGRIGIGWATVAGAIKSLTAEPSESTLTLHDIDTAIDQVAETRGGGSAAERQAILQRVFDLGSAAEQDFLRAVFTGGLRQGALGGVVTSAIAKANGVKVASVRRAAMLLGDLGEASEIA